LQKQSIVMHCSSTKFLNRRHNPRSLSGSNSTRTLKFKHSFVNTFPSSSPCGQYSKTNLLVPNQIKTPTSTEENV
jgi:hypothetical protein